MDSSACSGRSQKFAILDRVDIDRAGGKGDLEDVSRVTAENELGAQMIGKVAKLREKGACEESGDAGDSTIAGSSDELTKRTKCFDQRRDVTGGHVWLITNEYHERSELRVLGQSPERTGANRAAHAVSPAFVAGEKHVEIENVRLDLFSLAAGDYDDRRARGRGADRPAQKRVPFVLNELLGAAEAGRTAGGENDGADRSHGQKATAAAVSFPSADICAV